ncbi:hypothetical protein F1C12_20345 [Leifsonia shinshuensis]|uniref:Uncharacterized protein n=1 Tax=Leifsonia shinshuensis TaxID=150026 RepID=A0A7G6YH84_9MICO|nr:hypothetical protein F1C12_20345 [Leifsonia shinshuensis]
MNNVVSLRMDLRHGDELLEIIDDTVDDFRRALVSNGYYTTGPMVFRGLPDSREFTIMTTLGNRVNLVGAEGTGFEFRERIDLDTKFFYRHVDVEEPVPYAEIAEAVTAAGFRVETIYHVILDVYGDTMLDLYVEAEKP